MSSVKPAFPSLDEDLAPRKRIDLKSIRSAGIDDDAVSENSHKIGSDWGAQTSLVATSPPASAAEPSRPKVPLASLRIEVPDYLDRQLAFKAVERRVTKQYLVVEALQAAGYRVDEADLVEDKRKAKKR